MTKTYGYARISTNKQNIDRQVRNIKAAYPDAVIIKEAYTGTKVEGRTEFVKLMKTVKAGDTVVFDSVSRMSRDAAEGFALYEKWYNAGVNLVFIKEPHINTETYKNAAKAVPMTGTAVDLILNGINAYFMELAKVQIKLAFEQAEKEVADLRQRTREGIETARLNGKQIGQKAGRKLTVKKADLAKRIIKEHSKTFGGSMNDEQMMKLTGLSRPTYYKYKKEVAEEMRQEQAEAMRLMMGGTFAEVPAED